MSKKSEIGNEVANSMNDLLGDENFTRIFHNVKTASVKDAGVNVEAVSDYNSFEKFVTLAKKKDKDKDEDAKDSDKEDKKSDKKDKKSDKKEDKESTKDDKKDKKKGKKPFPFWLKKKKASDKCNCSEDCSCKTGKCDCEGCKDCAACGDKMYASAIKYMVETLTRTSAALDNMGLEKSAIATMVALNHIIEEAAQDKFASDESSLDENDVRGMDLLLGLDDPEALEGFEDEELDDPQSSHALEEILTKDPQLADELSSGLKNKFDSEHDIENQLRNRVKSRLDQVIDTKGDESDIEELAANKFPHLNNPANKLPAVNDYMKSKQNDEFGGNTTVPAPRDEWSGDNVSLDELNIDDVEVVNAYKELDAWVKSAETKTVEGDDLESLLETYIEG